MMWSHFGMAGAPFAGILLLMLLFAAAVAVAVSVLRGPAPSSNGLDAEATLAERYAQSEIDEEEYERRLDTLRTP